MAVVELPVEEVSQQLDDRLSVAVVNTRTSTVVSGDKEAIAAFVARLTEQGVFCRRVDVDYASHSRHMDAVLDELAEKLAGVSPQAAKVAMISTLTGAQIEGSALDARDTGVATCAKRCAWIRRWTFCFRVTRTSSSR